MKSYIINYKLDIYDPRLHMNPLKVEYFPRNGWYLYTTLFIFLLLSPLDWFTNFPKQYTTYYIDWWDWEQIIQMIHSSSSVSLTECPDICWVLTFPFCWLDTSRQRAAFVLIASGQARPGLGRCGGGGKAGVRLSCPQTLQSSFYNPE